MLLTFSGLTPLRSPDQFNVSRLLFNIIYQRDVKEIKQLELLESFHPFQLLKRLKPFIEHEQDLFLQFPYASYPLQYRRMRIVKQGIKRMGMKV